MLNKKNIFILSTVIILCSCQKEDPVIEEKETNFYSVSGYAQKGPYVNGASITIFELDEKFRQTGKSFSTTAEELGRFELGEIALSSSLIEVIADGFYFNEVTGKLSNERLKLRALAELSEGENLNINILTSLSLERIKYLITEEGKDLSNAKTQAQKEILSVFEMDEYEADQFELLDISGTEEDDAILLAISSIVLGNNTTAELSTLLANMVSDMKTDGVLNDTIIQNKLLGQAVSLSCDQISKNLVDRFAELESDLSSVNNFKHYIDLFVGESTFTPAAPFEFPKSTANGINVLNPDATEFNSGQHAFGVQMPGDGTIVIKMSLTSGGVWAYAPFQANGWTVTNYNQATKEQFFTSTQNGTLIDLPMFFAESGTALVEYFYNNSESPSFTKTISWGMNEDSELVFPDDSPAGPNLILASEDSVIVGDSTHVDFTNYTVGAKKPGSWNTDFVLNYSDNVNVSVLGGWGNYYHTDSIGQVYFTLSGKGTGDYISEIVLNITGNGQINLVCEDIEETKGETLNKFFTVE